MLTSKPEVRSPRSAKPGFLRRLRHRFLFRLAVYSFAAVAVFYPWRYDALIFLGEAWIIRDNIQKADVIFVLGGGAQSRPFEAARLYKSGFAPKILLAYVELNPTDRIGLTRPETELFKKILLVKGVSEKDIITIPGAVSSTFEEAATLKEWMKSNPAKTVAITTDLFHTRRARWVFSKVMDDMSLIKMKPSDPDRYTSHTWFRSEHGVIDFQNEVVKQMLYWVKY